MDEGSKTALVNQIQNEDWDAIAHTLITFDITLATNGNQGRKLKKELGLVKHVLYEHIKSNNTENLSASFFVGAVKTVKAIEKRFDSNKEERREFLVFLKLLIEKLKKQKIYVKKPMEIRDEFQKMKGVVEDESNSL